MIAPKRQSDGFVEMVEYLRAYPPKDAPFQILEAGCGRYWHPGTVFEGQVITGVDLDEQAMKFRMTEQGDLDVAIHGDLTTVDLPKDSYDLVYCSYVLEHVHEPEQVMDRFVSWVRPGGHVALLFPDRNTAKGIMTRITPFRLHVLYYRYVLKYEDAGKPGRGPYETIHAPMISRKGLHDYCRRAGLEVVYDAPLEMEAELDGAVAVKLARVVSFVTRGRFTHKYCNYMALVRRPPTG
jgi:SAM-dependent methyltransferase